MQKATSSVSKADRVCQEVAGEEQRGPRPAFSVSLHRTDPGAEVSRSQIHHLNDQHISLRADKEQTRPVRPADVLSWLTLA